MNRVLSGSLVLTVVLSAASLWTGRSADIVSVVQPRLRPLSEALVLSTATTQGVKPAVLPSAWTPTLMELARRDFFSPPAPAAAPPVALVPVFTAPIAPPPPPAPQMNYRFMGQMVTPQGEQLVYLSGQGEQAVAVKAGDSLEDGWKVDSIDAEGIHLLYPDGQQRAVISIPAAP